MSEDGLNSPQAKKMKSGEPQTLQIERSIKITDVPVPLPELTFMNFLEKVRIKHNICPNIKKAVTNWMSFANEGYVYVEFCSLEIASKMLDLKGASLYKHSRVKFESLMYLEDTVLQLNVTLEASRFPTNLQASTPTKNFVDMMQQLSPFQPKQILYSDSNNNVSDHEGDNVLNGIAVLSEVDNAEFAENVVIEVIENNAKDPDFGIGDIEENAKDPDFGIEDIEDSHFVDQQHNIFNKDNVENNHNRPKVTFGKLSEFYNDIDFINFLTVCITKKCTALPYSTDESFNLLGYNKETNSVTVQFMSAEVAKAVNENLQGVAILLQPWTVTLHKPPQRLLFSDISEFYKEVDFITFLNICIKKKCQVSSIDAAEIKIVSYNKNTHEVIVEFNSAELSKEVCTKLQNIEYMLQKWKISEIREGATATSPGKLKFMDISSASTKEGFSSFLAVCIFKKCGLADDVDTSFKVLNHDSTKNTVIVQFNSPDVAKAVCLNLQFMEYLFDKWTVIALEEESEDTPSFIAASPGPDKSYTLSTSTCNDLDDDERCLAFLEECVNMKGTARIFKGTKEAFEEIIESLKKRGIHTNLAECQRRKKRLDEQHRRGPHELWGKYLAYLRG